MFHDLSYKFLFSNALIFHYAIGVTLHMVLRRNDNSNNHSDHKFHPFPKEDLSGTYLAIVLPLETRPL